MCDLLKAFKTCFSVGEKFKMKYKRKKDNTDSIVIHLKHFNASRKREKKEQLSKSKAKKKQKKETFYDFIPKIKSSKKLPDLLEYDSRVIKDSLNQYWMCIPVRLDKKSFDHQEMKLKNEKMASIDLGVRNFSTIYGSDGICLKVAKGDVKNL